MLVSRDVIFLEGVFPYKDVATPTDDYPFSVSTLDDTSVSNDQASVSNDQWSVPTLPSTTVVSSWLIDFVCNISHDSTCSPIITSITPSHSEFVAAISAIREPQTYLEASTSPEWTSAMRAELSALETNEMWEITPLPLDKKPIGRHWVFKLNLNANGSIDMYKSYLVAKGYNQIEGIDYNESFSVVAKSVTVRLFFAMTAARDWHIHQMDVNNAFFARLFRRGDIYESS
ncbi:UNVERIFIED_CONTAM: hypothetical protein Sradi_6172500 [Sesamum radiatum]|uniref:Reverse transcriptase Ty1/copia-type domain-containing protein n=1 Tax=Sesamum radiatum TaxID=300843 RepID=A0AAW2K823_SESRA